MLNLSEIRRLVENYKGLYAAAGCIYPALLAVFSDFLKPLFNSTVLLVVLMALILLAEYIFYALGKVSARMAALNHSLAQETGGKWFAPFFIASLMAFCIFVWTFALNADDEDGYLAQNFKVLSNLQAALGMTNKHLADISEHTRKSAESLEKIDNKIGDLKKEKSEHPRKELANMGINWNEESYFKAIYDADLDALKLFWAGGMDPMAKKATKYNFANYTSRVPYVFLAITPENPNWEKILNIYLANEYFDLNDAKYDYYASPVYPADEMFLDIVAPDELFEILTEKWSPGLIILKNSLSNPAAVQDSLELLKTLSQYGLDLDVLDTITRRALTAYERRGGALAFSNPDTRHKLEQVAQGRRASLSAYKILKDQLQRLSEE